MRGRGKNNPDLIRGQILLSVIKDTNSTQLKQRKHHTEAYRGRKVLGALCNTRNCSWMAVQTKLKSSLAAH